RVLVVPVAAGLKRLTLRAPVARRGRQVLVGVVEVVKRQADLLQVVGARRPRGGFADLLDGGQQQADEHGDDGDDDQQLDQREALARRSDSHDTGLRIRVHRASLSLRLYAIVYTQEVYLCYMKLLRRSVVVLGRGSPQADCPGRPSTLFLLDSQRKLGYVCVYTSAEEECNVPSRAAGLRPDCRGPEAPDDHLGRRGLANRSGGGRRVQGVHRHGLASSPGPPDGAGGPDRGGPVGRLPP